MRLDYTGYMLSWLQRMPMWFRLAFFLGAIWLVVITLRLSGIENAAPFRWADARYFAAMWAVFAIAYYLGLIVTNTMKKK